ncbi:MAG: ABC transporter permease [Pyrinomonadaceae bacterium]|nr:ABC transporter permease [Pyrinomonadaceae bacterium]
MSTLIQDLRYGVKMLFKNPAFTIVAVISLALGIGANTAIFSIVNAVLFRPLPLVENQSRLVALYTSDYSGPLYGASSYPDYIDFRNRSDALSGLAAYTIRPVSLSAGGESERALATVTSVSYFDVLGVRAARGRVFTEADDAADAAPTVVISHGLWQRRFGGDASIVGKTITVSGGSFTVAGIAPEKFTGIITGLAPDMWIPIPAFAHAAQDKETVESRGNRGLFLIGRLKDGVSVEQAQASFDSIARGLREEHPRQWSNVREEGRKITVLREAEARVPPQVRGVVLGIAGLMMGVVGLVLLIACANVANLLLARASVRRREIGIRIALGASRWRIVRQLLTESILLALVGGAFGLIVVLWLTELPLWFSLPTPVPIALDFSPDARVLLFALCFSILTGLIFGIAPALQATRADVLPALKDESATASFTPRRFSLRNLLVVAQVAVSLVLLVGAGLFLRSLGNAQSIDVGFRADNVLIMTPEVGIQGYTEAKGAEFYRQLIERVGTLPGVEAVSLAEMVPLGFSSQRGSVEIEGRASQPGEDNEYNFNTVSPGYFETMNIKLVAGRDFTVSDREGAPGVVIINEAFARLFWPNQNPLGKRLSREGAEGPFLEVIGVARDAKYNTLGEDTLPYFYQPFWQHYRSEMTLQVRSVGDPRTLLAPVREQIRLLDKNLPVSNVRTLNEHLSGALLLPRIGAGLLGAFGFLALLLASVGLFGVMSFSVARRTREIGIRMALGARGADVLKLVLREGMTLVIVGVCLGLAASFALTRAMTSLLYGVSATDPLTFAGVALLLTSVALVASYIPARRASKVDPMIALRYE